MAANPFRFAPPGEVPPLLGRPRELQELLAAFAAGRNLCLVAPRGAGKSELLHEARAAARAAGMEVVAVDLFPALDARRFAEIYASALTLGPGTTVEAMQQAIQQLLPTLTPRITLGKGGRPSLQLDLWDRERDLRALLERLFAAPAELAKRTKKQVVVLFDDFEELITADESLLQPLAQSLRHAKGVSSCFVLRKEASAERLFNRPKSPLYHLAEPVVLGELPTDTLVAALAGRFREAGVEVDGALLRELVELAQRGLHSVRVLAYSLYDEAIGDERRAAAAHWNRAVDHVLGARATLYAWQWEQLSTLQRNLVLAIAQGHTERLHSQRMVFQLGLGSPSTVAKNIKVLADREVLLRQDSQLRFVDPLFGLWLSRRMT